MGRPILFISVFCTYLIFSNLERTSVVLRKRFAVELVHHLHDANDLFLSVEYRNAQQTLHCEPIFLVNLRVK